MGLFSGWDQNYVYYKKYTYEDLVKALEELFTNKTQNDTENVSFCNQKTN